MKNLNNIIENYKKNLFVNIDDIIQDLILIARGSKIHYIVDPYEIIDFSFPFGIHPNSNKSSNMEKGLTNELIEDQIALYELFYGLNDKVTILDEYVTEISGLIQYLEAVNERGNQLIETINKHFQDNVYNNINEDLKEIKKNIGLLLVTMLGINKNGFERLKDIAENRSITNSPENLSGDEIIIQDAFDNCKSHSSFDFVFDLFKEGRSYKNLDEVAKDRFRKNSYTDSLAIYRICQVNNYLEKKFNDGFLKNRHLFVYLSSNQKTNELVKHPKIKTIFPIIDKKPFNFFRNRKHLLYYITCKDHNKEVLDIKDTITNLKALKEIINHPNKDILNKSDIQTLSFISKINDNISSVFNKTKQLSFINNLYTYENEYIKLIESNNSNGGFIEALKKTFKIDTVKNTINRDEHIQFSKLKSFLRDVLINTLIKTKTEKLHFHINLKKDAVIGSSQFLPLHFMCISSPKYLKIIEEIKLFYINASLNKSKYNELFKEICLEIVEIEIETKAFNVELELTKCHLFFAVNDNDYSVFQYASSLLRANYLLPAIKNVAVVEKFKNDLRCIMIWARRRMQHHSDCNDQADRFINETAIKDEPRFWHGKALNYYSWYVSEKEKLNQISFSISNYSSLEEKIQKAIGSFNKASKLYYKSKEFNIPELHAAIYNSLTYMHIFESSLTLYSIEKSNHYLNQLLEIYPMDKWTANHPDYFHTYALVKFKEYKQNPSNSKLLYEANQGIILAKKIVKRDNYLDLFNEIQNFIKKEKVYDEIFVFISDNYHRFMKNKTTKDKLYNDKLVLEEMYNATKNKKYYDMLLLFKDIVK